MSFSRRSLLKAAGSSLFLPSLSFSFDKAGSKKTAHELKLGITSYTTRKLSLDETIKVMKTLNLNYMSIKDVHLALTSTKEERLAAAQKIKDAGINLVGCGTISIKKDENMEAYTRNAFEYARDLGIKNIICTIPPSEVKILDKYVKEFDIRAAIHNHGPEDKSFPTPDSIWDVISTLDERVGFCIDIGHTFRAGVDPAASIRKHAKRLYDMHLKDVDAQKANAKKVECGRGAIDLVAVMKALQDIKYANHVMLEYEINEDNPLPGMAESIGYVRGILAST